MYDANFFVWNVKLKTSRVICIYRRMTPATFFIHHPYASGQHQNEPRMMQYSTVRRFLITMIYFKVYKSSTCVGVARYVTFVIEVLRFEMCLIICTKQFLFFRLSFFKKYSLMAFFCAFTFIIFFEYSYSNNPNNEMWSGEIRCEIL